MVLWKHAAIDAVMTLLGKRSPLNQKTVRLFSFSFFLFFFVADGLSNRLKEFEAVIPLTRIFRPPDWIKFAIHWEEAKFIFQSLGKPSFFSMIILVIHSHCNHRPQHVSPFNACILVAEGYKHALKNIWPAHKPQPPANKEKHYNSRLSFIKANYFLSNGKAENCVY